MHAHVHAWLTMWDMAVQVPYMWKHKECGAGERVAGCVCGWICTHILPTLRNLPALRHSCMNR